MANKFREEDHPRDDDGKFTKKGNEESSNAQALIKDIPDTGTSKPIKESSDARLLQRDTNADGSNIELDQTWGFKCIKGNHSIDDDLKKCNPNYRKGREYQVNCQRVVATYEMRRRGLDVEALPCYDIKNDYLANNWSIMFKNAKKERILGSSEVRQKYIEHSMKTYGEGSRAIVYIAWEKKNKGHVFIVENEKGNIRFVDPQNNNVDASKYFKRINLKISTILCRIDNLETNKLIKECCKSC